MSEDVKKREKTHEMPDSDSVKELLGVVSSEVPTLIKNILASVFSEEAGRSMGKAAAAYYKELKGGGLPDSVAVKLTEDYMRTFTSIGDMLRTGGLGGSSGKADDLGEEIQRKIHERVESRRTEREEEKEE
jgi:hypothetical protein